MATLSFTNTLNQSACNGQGVRVVISGNTDAAKLSSLVLGQLATVSSSSKTGYISEIDLHGNGFVVTPKYPFSRFNSTSNAEGLATSETVTVTL